MKAISLWQPWATAIALGSKEYETRSWAFPASLTGQCIAIHAAKRWTLDQENLGGYWHWCAALSAKMGGDTFKNACPLGAVVALATLESCRTAGSMTLEELETERRSPVPGLAYLGAWTESQMGDFTLGRFAWKLNNVIALREPVPCKGAQGFFELPADVEASVRAQLHAEEALHG